MSADQRTIWKRRVGLMVAVALVVGVPLTIALRSGDDGAGGDGGSAPKPAVEEPALGDTKFLRDLGVELRVPEGWREEEQEGVLSLRSADSRAAIAISAPGPAAQADRIREDAITVLRDQYRDVQVIERVDGKELGGLPATTEVLTARRAEDDLELRVLVSTAEGDENAYLVEVFASAPGADRALAEAQALLDNLKFEG